MALYTELQVFEDTYQLFLQIVVSTANMQRDCKFSLGEMVKRAAMDMLILIFKANKSAEKRVYISQAREKLVEVQIVLRVFNDMKQLSNKQFTMFMERTTSVSKQLTAWERSATK